MSKQVRRAVFLLFSITLLIVLGTSVTQGPHLVDSFTGSDSLLHPSTILNASSTSGTNSEERIPGVIMPKLLNETAKADLGRHSWYLFHTVLARFPERPTPNDRDDLGSFITYFAKLYPCGDCAAHFNTLLMKYPPQTSSRISAAQWGCAIHNKVNLDLGKQEYDCTRVLENYDCGCGEDTK